MVRAGEFRDDLYYRLDAATIFVPPLRERCEAIPAFVAHFIEHYNRLFDKDVKFFARLALDALVAYPWPGNVRELAHALESAVILTENDRIAIADLPDHVLHAEAAVVGASNHFPLPATAPASAPVQRDEPWPFLLDEVIKKTLLRSLEETEGNRRRAANLLGVSRSTLYRMLSRYGLAEAPRKGRTADISQ
jgi:DNA-binding NtrC family response regulator